MSQPLKGAAGHVLRTITSYVHAGRPAVSYVTISVETGYSVPTVQTAVEILVRDEFIRVEKQRSGRPHIYSLVSEEARRIHLAARLVNLIE